MIQPVRVVQAVLVLVVVACTVASRLARATSLIAGALAPLASILVT